MIEHLFSFAVTEWLGTIWTYVLAGILIAGGIYLAGFVEVADKSPLYPFLKPLRYVGFGLAAFGLVLGCAGYFKHVGAQACETAWREKNLEARIADLQTNLEAWKATAAEAEQRAAEAAARKRDSDNELADYRETIRNLPPATADCRRASADDDRRLCRVIGNRAPGCQPAGVRPGTGRLPAHR